MTVKIFQKDRFASFLCFDGQYAKIGIAARGTAATLIKRNPWLAAWRVFDQAHSVF